MRSPGEVFPGYCRVAARGPKRAEVVPYPLPLRATGGLPLSSEPMTFALMTSELTT